MTPWWTEQVGAYIGAFGGASAGVFGGAFGAAVGVLAPRGKCKGVVMGFHFGLVAIGAVAGAAGVAALAMGQPRHVYYPLLLGGGILTIVLGSLVPVVQQRYREAEERRLNAKLMRDGQG